MSHETQLFSIIYSVKNLYFFIHCSYGGTIAIMTHLPHSYHIYKCSVSSFDISVFQGDVFQGISLPKISINFSLPGLFT